jgi:hypothetical protein
MTEAKLGPGISQPFFFGYRFIRIPKTILIIWLFKSQSALWSGLGGNIMAATKTT